jgi:tRNA nucleotidyltransferase (CCA-adding enzyme)
MGLPPGPTYKRILWELRAAWLDGLIRTKKDEKKLLTRLAEEGKSHPEDVRKD